MLCLLCTCHIYGYFLCSIEDSHICLHASFHPFPNQSGVDNLMLMSGLQLSQSDDAF